MQKKTKIKVSPPGPKARKIISKDKKFIACATKTSPIAARRAKGALIEDVDGNTYLDFTSGVGVVNTGHCHPEVVKAVSDQAEELMHFAGTDFYYDVQNQLAENLSNITPGRFDKKVFFTNSGTESNECALKLARWSTGRKRFIAFINAFHGRTMGSLSFTASKVVQKEKYFPMMPGVTHIPFAYCYRCAYKMEYPDCDVWCAKILDEVYFDSLVPPNEVAALFLEPVQGEGGYIVPPKKFMQEIEKITKKHKIIMVDDEVQAGFGRTGKWFGIEHHGIEPDIFSLAKGMGSGMPIGACVFSAKYDFGVPGAHSNTYGGNLVACASSLASIRVIKKEKLISRAGKLGELVTKRLNEMKEKHRLIGDARGIGLMQAVELVKNRKTKTPAIKEVDRILKHSYKNGLILLPCGTSGVRFIPPLVIKEDELNEGLDIFEKALSKVK
ncbi:MAG: acetyl ornithine aminotransferase family protein [Thermoplasmata archaeon]|nr:MAG: acetyl ornithine aminotransferase family protein [Thermoplasmata archaeon]